MAARRRMYEFTKGPKTSEARKLAKEVFALMDKLGLKYPQMAEQSGLSVSQLRSIKTNWVNPKTVSMSYMSPTLANGLVRFWNANLKTPFPKEQVKLKRKYTKRQPQNESANGSSLVVVKVLVHKVGITEATALLEQEGKADLLEQYLAGLSPEELASLA